jgi:hypothetical protein
VVRNLATRLDHASADELESNERKGGRDGYLAKRGEWCNGNQRTERCEQCGNSKTADQ